MQIKFISRLQNPGIIMKIEMCGLKSEIHFALKIIM